MAADQPRDDRRISRFVFEISREADSTARAGGAHVYVRASEYDDGTKQERPLSSLSTVEGTRGQPGREKLRQILRGLVDEIVGKLGDIDEAEVTLWTPEQRARRL